MRIKLTLLGGLLLFLTADSGDLFAQQEGSRAARLFEQLDQNGDGTLDANEVPEAQQPFFERTRRMGDQNGDGALSRAEFLRALQQAMNGNGSPDNDRRPTGPPPAIREQGRMFDVLDTDQDGSLTLAEIPPPLRPRFEPLFDRLNVSALSREQFVGVIGQPGPAADAPSKPDQPVPDFLKNLDRNGDGMVSRVEAPEEMSPVFDRLGLNQIPLQQLIRFNAMRSRDDPPRPPQERVSEMPRPAEGRPEPDRGMPPGRPPFGPPRGGQFEGGGMSLRIVRELDSDENGTISRAELSQLMMVFDRLDADGNGELDARELIGGRPPEMGGFPGGRDGFRGRPGRGPEERGFRGPARDAESEDTSEEGSPAAAERRSRSPLDRPDASFRTPPRRENLLESLESQPDQDLGRFDPSNRESRRIVAPREGVPYLFDLMDSNQDSLLTREEVQGNLREEFDRVDVNRDGKISQDEYRQRLRSQRPRILESETPAEQNADSDSAEQ